MPGVADIPGCGCGLHQRRRGTADPAQKDLYGNGMLKSNRNLVALGHQLYKPEVITELEEGAQWTPESSSQLDAFPDGVDRREMKDNCQAEHIR
ncbi:zinc finger protein 713-like [Alexandromys fortis]|uniref:zinc finger protein 713-like n=1 Tax=Alexandromys fortis TaxID=100897 RepID=UPI0021522A19|nr:zinc finger protein 713-like [Microtus fortis]